jgi:hypothetical protein
LKASSVPQEKGRGEVVDIKAKAAAPHPGSLNSGSRDLKPQSAQLRCQLGSDMRPVSSSPQSHCLLLANEEMDSGSPEAQPTLTSLVVDIAVRVTAEQRMRSQAVRENAQLHARSRTEVHG